MESSTIGSSRGYRRRVEFEAVAAAVSGIPWMSPELGRRVYDHIRSTEATDVLDLGTGHGVSAVWMAAALEANGRGHVTTVDLAGADYNPPPAALLARVGLAHRVTVVREHSSYNWFLKERIEERSDAAGNCEPAYDFCYLDGAKNLNVDGLAVVLVERLLRPGGCLLMDDLDWTYVNNHWLEPAGDGRPLGPVSEAERTQPHLRAVFDLLVRAHPSFTRCVVEDEWYGWAYKQPGEPRRYEVRTSRPLGALVAGKLRHVVRRGELRRKERLRGQQSGMSSG
jgi:predicted O-methyltransferase YrrM